MGGGTIAPHSLKTERNEINFQPMSNLLIILKVHKDENLLAPILKFVLFHS